VHDPGAEGPADKLDEDGLEALFRQWMTPGRPSGEIRILARTTPEDRAGLPWFRLLGVGEEAVDGGWAAWDAAQVASDATALDAGVRALVVLVPAGGRWIVGRSVGGSCLLEPLDHPTPVAALRAAETVFRLIVSGRIREETIPQRGEGEPTATGGGAAPTPGAGKPGDAREAR
jgi:hypothetical protein